MLVQLSEKARQECKAALEARSQGNLDAAVMHFEAALAEAPEFLDANVYLLQLLLQRIHSDSQSIPHKDRAALPLPRAIECLSIIHKVAFRLRQDCNDWQGQAADIKEAQRRLAVETAGLRQREAECDRIEGQNAEQTGQHLRLGHELATQRSSLAQQEQVLTQAQVVLREKEIELAAREQAIAERDIILAEREEIERDWATAITEQNELKLDFLQVELRHLGQELNERHLQLKQIDTLHKQIQTLQQEISELQPRVLSVKQQAALQKEIGKLQSRQKQIEKQLAERVEVEQRRDELQANLERLSELAIDLPPLREQVKTLEQLLGSPGLEAESLEQRLAQHTPPLVILADATLAKLQQDVGQALKQLREQEQAAQARILELRGTEEAIHEALERYRQMEPGLSQRLAILQKYQAADTLVSQPFQKEQGLDTLLDTVTALLAQADITLQAVIENNEAAQRLEPLYFGGES